MNGRRKNTPRQKFTASKKAHNPIRLNYEGPTKDWDEVGRNWEALHAAAEPCVTEEFAAEARKRARTPIPVGSLYVGDSVEPDDALTGQSVEKNDRQSGTNVDRKAARQAFLKPILDRLGFSNNDWAKAGSDPGRPVDVHTVNDYWSGKTNPYRSTRKRMAVPLGIKVEELPD
jgi:hypothetical protein